MFSEKNLHNYGTPLPLLEFDQVPSKKPIHIQDQIATDEQGRRRFHGAFTGGFSAGYWNTVGSKEGWTPQSFKSSRTEKATENLTRKPEDFMDDEDLGEFGIAPKTLKVKDDFTSVTDEKEVRKRKFLQNDLQPIPGEPVLHQLIKPIKDKVAVSILKSWGWRPGQGIGPRQTRKEKKKAKERNKKELYLIERYGCELPSTSSSKTLINSDDDDDDDEDSEDEDDEITFAPEDCELPPHQIKQDKYGIGYEPLSRHSVLGGSSSSKASDHINLFQPLEAIGKNNQKISFSGQAFGVGALEEDDDEDVYNTVDMTRYDFSLEDKKTKKIKSTVNDSEELLFGEFVLDRNPPETPIYNVDVPFGWQPRNWNEKRSRFEPLDARKQKNLEKIFSTYSNEEDMTRKKRAELLGEELSIPKENTKEIKSKTVEELQQEYKERKERTKQLMEKITAKSSSFTVGGIINIEGEEKSSSSENVTSNFKPFATDERKQNRYEQFSAKEFKNEQEMEDFLTSIQPVELSLWDRQMELKEFIQAKKLYKPLKGIMSDRFITESEIKAVQIETKKEANKQIVVERSKEMWKPHSLLCKRYNIPEPFKGLVEGNKNLKTKQKKLSVFDYIDISVNKKGDFQTPVIIPKNIEKPKEITSQDVQPNKPKEDTPLEWQEVLQPSEKSKKETKAYVFKPKTELEKKVVESINKPLVEKTELFKAIFSDSESEEDIEEENSKNEVVPAASKPLTATEANLLRNNSPPRGIFKALFTTTAAKPKDENATETTRDNIHDISNVPAVSPTETPKVIFKPKSAREYKDLEVNEETPEVYGPALPKTHKSVQPNSPKSSVNERLLDLLHKHKPNLQVTEKWMEKSSNRDDTSDSEESHSSSSSEDRTKTKKKSKKSKKKKDSKHKKHKDNKSSKKSRNHNKKKKKNKK